MTVYKNQKTINDLLKEIKFLEKLDVLPSLFLSSQDLIKWRRDAQMAMHYLSQSERLEIIKNPFKSLRDLKNRNILLMSPKTLTPNSKLQQTKTRQIKAPKIFGSTLDNEDGIDEASFVLRPLMTQEEALNNERKLCQKFLKTYKTFVKRSSLKFVRTKLQNKKEKILNAKKMARECARVVRQKIMISRRATKDFQVRAKRLFRETQIKSSKMIIKENIRSVTTPLNICNNDSGLDEMKKAALAIYKAASKKKNEKIANEQRKADLDLLESKRQQKKLDFLITQTELYAHFMSKKMKNDDETELDEKTSKILTKLDYKDDDDSEQGENKEVKAVIERVKIAVDKEKSRADQFNAPKYEKMDVDDENLNENEAQIIQEPNMFVGELKQYQKQGLSWLLSLFDQGINGILADEMGLGKTIQTIAFLASLAEKYNIWGPFLIVTPASTLHNWTQEFAKFMPSFRLIPYWGNPNERRILRRFWSNINNPDTKIGSKAAEFHVVVTSYQFVLLDAKFFNKTAWNYLVLDEAHSIKSTSSLRWKILLSFQCRNRLLLTGTPIQNTMQELWALLHFIMPSLFDSHDEFSAWFSKDIENQAAAATSESGGQTSHSSNSLATCKLDAKQLERLHMILKPFMLRRVKTQVQDQISSKTEVLVHCPLTSRQRCIYDLLKRKIVKEDLNLDNPNALSLSASSSLIAKRLMNLVMQLRKVCNHPELLEVRQVGHSLTGVDLSENLMIGQIKISQDSIQRFGHHFNNRLPKLLYNFICKQANFHVNRLLKKFTQFNIISDSLIQTRSKRLFSDSSDSFVSVIRLVNISELKAKSFDIQLAKRQSIIPSSLYFTTHQDHIYSHGPWIIHGRSGDKTYEFLDYCLPKFLCHAYLPKVLSKSTKFYTSLSGLRDIFKTHSGTISIDGYPGLKSISLISRSKILTDSGKMIALVQLLTRLKAEGHRVLIYSQMTKMIDLLEDLLQLKQYKYLRLDGSSRLCDRRDMVSQWQTNNSWFIFLLSTRAGGLGINLTAADTVIFYDSDWNPTVDQQAMDRAHRLGQKKPVTVYRFACKNTVEMRMLQRAQEKRTMQHLVIKDDYENCQQDDHSKLQMETTSNLLVVSEQDNQLKSSDLADLLREECEAEI